MLGLRMIINGKPHYSWWGCFITFCQLPAAQILANFWAVKVVVILILKGGEEVRSVAHGTYLITSRGLKYRVTALS